MVLGCNWPPIYQVLERVKELRLSVGKYKVRKGGSGRLSWTRRWGVQLRAGDFEYPPAGTGRKRQRRKNCVIPSRGKFTWKNLREKMFIARINSYNLLFCTVKFPGEKV